MGPGQKDGTMKRPIDDMRWPEPPDPELAKLQKALEENKDKYTRLLSNPKRKSMKPERRSVTHDFEIEEHDEANRPVKTHECRLIVGLYDDGKPGEVFLRVSELGPEYMAYDLCAIFLSIGLQYGIPLQEFIEAAVWQKIPPGGGTGNPEIPYTGSIFDYCAKWLDNKFFGGATIRKLTGNGD